MDDSKSRHGAMDDRISRRHLIRSLAGGMAALASPALAQSTRTPFAHWVDAFRPRAIERGWGTPAEMNGSWAGAMGHTQWMPEVWLNVGMDYDHDGRVSPFGKPDDALGSTARYLVNRGKYRRGEHWGYEVRVPAGVNA